MSSQSMNQCHGSVKYETLKLFLRVCRQFCKTHVSPSSCWWGLMVNSWRIRASLGRTFLIKNASMVLWPKTSFHGSKILFAEQSLGCQLVSPLASLCRMVGYSTSSLSPYAENQCQQYNITNNLPDTYINIPMIGNQGWIQASMGILSVSGFQSSTAFCTWGNIDCSNKTSSIHGGRRGIQFSRSSSSGWQSLVFHFLLRSQQLSYSALQTPRQQFSVSKDILISQNMRTGKNINHYESNKRRTQTEWLIYVLGSQQCHNLPYTFQASVNFLHTSTRSNGSLQISLWIHFLLILKIIRMRKVFCTKYTKRWGPINTKKVKKRG